MSDIHLTESTRQWGLRCPVCHGSAEGLTGIGPTPGQQPQPGQFGMCGYCGATLCLTESFAAYRNVSLRVASQSEVEAWYADNPERRVIWKTMRDAVRAGRFGRPRPRHE